MIEINENESDIRIASSIIESINEYSEEYMKQHIEESDDYDANDLATSRLMRIAQHIMLEIGVEIQTIS